MKKLTGLHSAAGAIIAATVALGITIALNTTDQTRFWKTVSRMVSGVKSALMW